MRERVRELLVCPDCRAELRWGEDVSCDGCGARYEMEDGVPRLIAGSRSPSGMPHAVPENEQMRTRIAGRRWLKRLVDFARPPLPYDRAGRLRGQRRFDLLVHRNGSDEAMVLDLGSGSNAEALRGLAGGTLAGLIRTDIVHGRHLDFVSDAHRIPIRDQSVDGVVLQGVVEHVARPWIVADEIVRVLKPEGAVFCEAPFVQWYHDDPGDYYRFTEEGLKQLFAGCDCVESGVAIGPVCGVLGVARELVPSFFKSPYVYWPAKWLISWLSYPLVLLDRAYRNRPRAKNTALAVYVVMQKGRPAATLGV